jgi:hypothetical protein
VAIALYKLLVILRILMIRPRNTPPSPEEVKTYQWWWSIPEKGYGEPHVMQLDLDEHGDIIILDNIGQSGSTRFDPDDWPGDWAVAKPSKLSILFRILQAAITLCWFLLGFLVYYGIKHLIGY